MQGCHWLYETDHVITMPILIYTGATRQIAPGSVVMAIIIVFTLSPRGFDKHIKIDPTMGREESGTL